MAASLMTGSSDITKCSRCHQLLKSPRTLPCLHSYCISCLQRHVEETASDSKVKCEECREKFEIPTGGLREWQPLAIVQRLTEQKATQMRVVSSSEEMVHCTLCAGVADAEEQQGDMLDLPSAVCRCVECDDYLCERCVTRHKLQRVLKTHSVITLDELRQGKFPDVTSPEQKMCVKHTDEALLFYCETCVVPICRQCMVIAHRHPDHKQVELGQAAKEMNEQLQQMQERCRNNDNKVNKALQDIRKIKRDFDLAVSEARVQIKDTVKKLKSLYLRRLDEAQKVAEEELNTIEVDGLETINTADEQLTSIITRISTAKTATKLLIESGSAFEVASDYRSLKAMLQDVAAAEPLWITHDAQSLIDVKFEENTGQTLDKIVIGQISSFGKRCKRESGREVRNKQAAVQKMQFGNDGNERLSLALDVVMTPTREIAVTDHSSAIAKVKIFNADGTFKSAFNVNVGVDADKPSRPWCISVSPDNLFYVTDTFSPYVKIFDLRGTFKRYFHTVSPDDVAYSDHGSSTLSGLAINSKRQVLVGNNTHKFISCHALDGAHLMSITVSIYPYFLGITSTGSIIVSSYTTGGEAHIIDESGKLLSKLQTPIGVSSWTPAGLEISRRFYTDDGEDEVLVVDHGYAVYRYSASGKYINCVTKGVSNVRGLALSTDEEHLFVACNKSVKCFELQT